MLMDPIYTLQVPTPPPNTITTLVPDRVRPSFASEYELWKFIYYKESRKLLKEFFDRALGGIPEGSIGVADALTQGKLNGQAVLEGWTGSVGAPSFKRTMEAIIDQKCRVMSGTARSGSRPPGRSSWRRRNSSSGCSRQVRPALLRRNELLLVRRVLSRRADARRHGRVAGNR
jgi:hypothetical protein